LHRGRGVHERVGGTCARGYTHVAVRLKDKQNKKADAKEDEKVRKKQKTTTKEKHKERNTKKVIKYNLYLKKRQRGN
jgi:hypothetical protein